MRCRFCYQEIEDGAFCKWCGKSQVEGVQQPSPPIPPPLERVANRTVPAKAGSPAQQAGQTPQQQVTGGLVASPLPASLLQIPTGPPVAAPNTATPTPPPQTAFPQTSAQPSWQPPPAVVSPRPPSGEQPTVLQTIASAEVPIAKETPIPQQAVAEPASKPRSLRPALATEESPSVRPTPPQEAGRGELGLLERVLAWPRPLLIGLLAVVPLVVVGLVVTLILLLVSGPDVGQLPIDPHRLPPTTQRVSLHQLTLPGDETASTFFRASLFGRSFCAPDTPNPWFGFESASLATFARRLGDEQRAKIRELLVCGARIAGQAKDRPVGQIAFKGDEEEKKTLYVEFIELDDISLPATGGWMTHSFAGLAGHCQGGCVDSSAAVLSHEGIVYWGKKKAIAKLAPHLAQPAEELSTGLEALQIAASHASGLSQRRLQVNPKSTKVALQGLCRYGRTLSGWRLKGELCFPDGLDERLEAHDATLRAVSFDEPPTLQGVERLRLALTLVARDEEAAEALGKTLVDFTRDWRAHVTNNAAKIAKTAADEPKTAREKIYKALVSAYVRGMKGLEVERDGRAVQLIVDTPLTEAELKEVGEVEQSDARRANVAALLGAIVTDQKPPTKALAALTEKAVGRSMERVGRAAKRHFDKLRRRASYSRYGRYGRYSRRYRRHRQPAEPASFPRSVEEGTWLDGKAFHAGASWLGFSVQADDLALYQWRYRAVGVGAASSYTLEARLSHDDGSHTVYQLKGSVDETMTVLSGKVREAGGDEA